MIKKLISETIQWFLIVTLIAGSIELLLGKNQIAFYPKFIGSVFVIQLLSNKILVQKLGFWKITLIGISTLYISSRTLYFFNLDVVTFDRSSFMVLWGVELLLILLLTYVTRKNRSLLKED